MRKNKEPTFVDLFAGIGGTRIAFERAGCRCVFSSEWDKYAQITYEANFGEKPEGDIRYIASSDIPDHDILVAGFPCQPFSISGVSKRKSLNMPHGLDDPTQGTLFYEIKRIISDKRPAAYMLENVKNLKSHNGGETYRIIRQTLEDELGYSFEDEIIDAVRYVPQHRERIYMVGFRDCSPGDSLLRSVKNASEIRDSESKPRFRKILEENVDEKYTLSDHLWKYLQEYAKKHREKGHGFGYGLTDLEGHSRTLSARYYKDGSEILVPQDGKNPRRLTPKECARLMGFTNLCGNFKFPVSDTQAYKQFGNSVVVPLVYDIAMKMVPVIGKIRDKEHQP